MKKLTLLALCIFYTFRFVQAQESFSGKIAYGITLQGEGTDAMAAFMPNSYEYYVEDNKLRFQINGGLVGVMMGYFVFDGKKDQVFMVKESEETAYYFPDDNEEEKAIEPQITKMNEVETILGYSCQKYKVITKSEDGQESTQFQWVTDKISFGEGKKLGDHAGGVMVRGIKGVPLKIFSEVDGMTMILTATEVKKMNVPDEMFNIPSNYELKEFDPTFGTGSLGTGE